jgi:hypothetical protein
MEKTGLPPITSRGSMPIEAAELKMMSYGQSFLQPPPSARLSKAITPHEPINLRQNLLRNQASYKELNDVSTSNALSFSIENMTPGQVSGITKTNRVKLPKLKLKMLDTDSGDEQQSKYLPLTQETPTVFSSKSIFDTPRVVFRNAERLAPIPTPM